METSEIITLAISLLAGIVALITAANSAKQSAFLQMEGVVKELRADIVDLRERLKTERERGDRLDVVLEDERKRNDKLEEALQDERNKRETFEAELIRQRNYSNKLIRQMGEAGIQPLPFD